MANALAPPAIRCDALPGERPGSVGPGVVRATGAAPDPGRAYDPEAMSSPPVDTSESRPAAAPSGAARRSDPVGLTWLIRLRWLTVAAQALAVGTAGWMGDRAPPTGPLVVLGAIAVSNAALIWLAPERDAARLTGPILVMDTALLAVLLHLTGGPMNPFTALFFVHITLAAVLLDVRWIALVLVVSLLGFGLLFAFDAPAHHDASSDLSAHLRGMWIAFAVSATLIAFFVSRLTRELARRDRELADERERRARGQRLAAVASLAAGAAHELGTPIGSIALAAGELDHALADAPAAVREDVQLIRTEVKRCRRILDGLAVGAGEVPGEGFARVPLEALIDAALSHLSSAQRARVEVRSAGGALFLPRAAIALGLASLLRNALEASDGPVRLEAEVRGERAILRVTDDGVGMDEDTLARAEEPFFGTKPGGMGLGLFLVRALAEQLGGALVLRSAPGRGTTARLELPAPGGPS